MIDEKVVCEKIIAMFKPYDGLMFLDFPGDEVIVGPNDRALFGYDNNFPIKWLMEDYDFTKDEATWFVSKVHELHIK